MFFFESQSQQGGSGTAPECQPSVALETFDQLCLTGDKPAEVAVSAFDLSVEGFYLSLGVFKIVKNGLKLVIYTAPLGGAGVLFHIAYPEPPLCGDHSRGGLQLSAYQLEQRGLAGSVAADQPRLVTGLKLKAQVSEQLSLTEGHAQLAYRQHRHTYRSFP